MQFYRERAEKAEHIRHNVHESIYDIVSNMPALSIPLQNPKNVQSQHYILQWGPSGPLEYTEVRKIKGFCYNDVERYVYLENINISHV